MPDTTKLTAAEKIERQAKIAGDREAKRVHREAVSAARKKAAETEKKKKIADAAKKKAAAEREKIEKAAITKLAPMAKVINTRMDKYNQGLVKADDHRLAAAIEMDAAKQVCIDAKIPFKRWCEENCPEHSYETIRKLAAVGGSDNPTAALEDMRNRNNKANKDYQDKKRSKGGSMTSTALGKTPEAVAIEALNAIEYEAPKRVILEQQARAIGYEVVKKGEEPTTTLDSLKVAFDALSDDDQDAFVAFIADALGLTMEIIDEEPEEAAVEDDDGDDDEDEE